MAVMFGVVAIGFAGCSSDSEDGGSTSNESSDYIEVSINAMDYTAQVAQKIFSQRKVLVYSTP